MFDLQRLVETVQSATGPKRPKPNIGPVEKLAQMFVTYRTDPGEAAYWNSRNAASVSW